MAYPTSTIQRPQAIRPEVNSPALLPQFAPGPTFGMAPNGQAPGTTGWGTIAQPQVDYSGGSNPSAGFTPQKPATEGSGLLETLTAAAPVVGVIGGIGSLIMSGYGMYLQNKAQKKQEEMQQQAIDNQNYWAKVQNAINERERKRQWAWMNDDKTYQRRIAAVNMVLSQAANNKQLQNNLVSIWGGRA